MLFFTMNLFKKEILRIYKKKFFSSFQRNNFLFRSKRKEKLTSNWEKKLKFRSKHLSPFYPFLHTSSFQDEYFYQPKLSFSPFPFTTLFTFPTKRKKPFLSYISLFFHIFPSVESFDPVCSNPCLFKQAFFSIILTLPSTEIYHPPLYLLNLKQRNNKRQWICSLFWLLLRLLKC